MIDGLIALALIPLGWSAVIYAAKRVCLASVPGDQVEKRILAIMVAPVLGAVLLLAWASIAPVGEPGSAVRLAVNWVPMTVSEATAAPGIDWPRMVVIALAVLYAGGAGFGACTLLVARRRRRQFVSRGIRYPEWHDVLVTDMAMSAFAIGRATVVMSRGFLEALAPEQIALVVAHERAHLRRRDPAYFELLAWFDVVFWFNPFLRRQTCNCRLAAEVACDATVVASAPSMRKAYASAIVTALRHTAGDALACAPAAISPRNLGDHGMRIGEIMSPTTRRGKRAGWGVFVLAAVLTVPAGALQLAYAQAASGISPFMMVPLSGPISSGYGDNHPFQGKARFHDAVDIVAKEGTPIVAPAAGRVVHVYPDYGNYGEFLEIDHGNGLVTRYAHLQSIEVKVGQHVEAGQLIGRVGNTGISTGPHLHLQVLRNGKSIDPAEVFNLQKG